MFCEKNLFNSWVTGIYGLEGWCVHSNRGFDQSQGLTLSVSVRCGGVVLSRFDVFREEATCLLISQLSFNSFPCAVRVTSTPLQQSVHEVEGRLCSLLSQLSQWQWWTESQLQIHCKPLQSSTDDSANALVMWRALPLLRVVRRQVGAHALVMSATFWAAIVTSASIHGSLEASNLLRSSFNALKGLKLWLRNIVENQQWKRRSHWYQTHNHYLGYVPFLKIVCPSSQQPASLVCQKWLWQISPN